MLAPAPSRSLVSARVPAKCLLELVATGDVELAVDPAQVRLGGIGGDEQRLGDLAVGEAFGGEPRDAQFAGGERVAASDRVPPWLGTGGDQLGARMVRDPPRPQAVGEIKCPLELGARLHTAAGTSQRRPMI